jgi:hypothetical protein
MHAQPRDQGRAIRAEEFAIVQTKVTGADRRPAATRSQLRNQGVGKADASPCAVRPIAIGKAPRRPISSGARMAKPPGGTARIRVG